MAVSCEGDSRALEYRGEKQDFEACLTDCGYIHEQFDLDVRSAEALTYTVVVTNRGTRRRNVYWGGARKCWVQRFREDLLRGIYGPPHATVGGHVRVRRSLRLASSRTTTGEAKSTSHACNPRRGTMASIVRLEASVTGSRSDRTTLEDVNLYRRALDTELSRHGLPAFDFSLHVRRHDSSEPNLAAFTLRVTQHSTGRWMIYAAGPKDYWLAQLQRDLALGSFGRLLAAR